jgi:hypothetical protein
LIPLFIIVHVLALFSYPENSLAIHKIVSNILQFIGLIVVFKAVNDNIKIVNRSSLMLSFSEWLNTCPLRKKNITLQVNTTSTVSIAENVKVHTTRKTETMEEKVNYAFEEIGRLERDIGNLEKKLGKEVDGLKVTLGELTTNQESKLEDIRMRLNKVFAEGAKEEIFGIACIFYSLIASLFS